MIVGVPKETKPDEYRIALRPVGADMLGRDGHYVLVERGAGIGSGFSDEAYESVGATIVNRNALFERAELIVKVKEPQEDEIQLLSPEQIVFGYFHFAGSLALTESCLNSGFTAIAYETLRDAAGTLPLLTPMSEIAGRMSIQAGATYLEQPRGGRGILLAGVAGVERGRVVVLGGGVVGSNAAMIAAGIGAEVVIMDIDLVTLRTLSQQLPPNVTTVFSDPHALDLHISQADLVIGAVLLPGREAPKLLGAQQIMKMKPGSVLVDVCIDQGGCSEHSRPTTHSDPVFVQDDVLHYCVANMPGAVGRTSTHALCNATLPYVRRLAASGLDAFIKISPGHAAALNTRHHQLINRDVAAAFPDLPHG
ncbi:MAG: alanine dehydrogenase [Polyangiaceae bacterium]|nr:alanine dehydrogenase [Polyangiaceae bacterium]